LELNKEGRRVRMKQLQLNKRKAILEQKRIGSFSGPPKIVVKKIIKLKGILSMGSKADSSLVKKIIDDSSDETDLTRRYF
jgi:hypothetical protein